MPTKWSLKIVQAVTAVRWGTRFLSALILLFWGWFLIAHIIGEEARASRQLVASDYVILSALVVSLLGLIVAWIWEFAGGIVTLAAMLIGAYFNWKILAFPGTLIPMTAALFLTCWWVSRVPPNRDPQTAL